MKSPIGTLLNPNSAGKALRWAHSGRAGQACCHCWFSWRDGSGPMVAGRGEIGSVAAPPPPSSSLPKPPQGCGPPPSRRPVARLAAASPENATAVCVVEAPQAPNINPYGLSDDALMRKQQFDRARAHKNSAVRAVRCLCNAQPWALRPLTLPSHCAAVVNRR